MTRQTHRSAVASSIRAIPAVVGCALALSAAVSVPSTQAAQRELTQLGIQSSTNGAAGVQTVTLVTGDTVRVDEGASGGVGATVTPANPDGPGAAFQSYALHGHDFVVPATAVPYLGTTLDPSLFDVTPNGSQAGGENLMVAVTFRPDTTPHALPGMTAVTQPEPNTLVGSLTPSSAKEFGAALAEQWRFDQDQGHITEGSGPLFDGVARIAPEGTAGPTAPSGAGTAGKTGSALTMYTLTVNGIDALGQADSFDRFFVMNVDDGRKYEEATNWHGGVAKISVPAGNYTIASFFYRPVARNEFQTRLVTIPEFRVQKDMTLTLDARTATSQLAVSTPRATTFASNEMGFLRQARAVGTLSTTFINTLPQNTLYAKATDAPPKEGTVTYDSFWRLKSPPTTDPSYTYDLEFPSSGTIPADQQQNVSEDQLATLDTSYRSPVQDRPEAEARLSYLPGQPLSARATQPLTAPLQRTEYVSASPDLAWQHVMDGWYVFGQTPQARTDDGYRTYTPGQHEVVNWLQQPIHPTVPVDYGVNPASFPFECPACRIDNTIALDVLPFGDSEPGHVGYPDNPASGLDETRSATLYEDDQEIATGTDPVGVVPVAGDPATYRLVYDVTRSSPTFTLSTQTHTEWTFHSQPSKGKDTAPSGWICPGATQQSSCTVLPLLQLGYDLPVDQLGRVSSGPVQVTVHVSHQQASEAAPVTSAGLQVSFDDGATWTPATLSSQSGDSYLFQLTVPPSADTNGFGELRMVATDGDGGQITQTITRAFAVTDSADTSEQATRACDAAGPTQARCFALVQPDGGQHPASAQDVPGYGPQDLQAAYQLPIERGQGQTIAIVDAFDDPAAEADLAVYRNTFGLPPCTTANGCFKKVNQRGVEGEYPPPNSSWILEISADLQMVSAACPRCNILLVEGDSNSVTNLAAAVDTAAQLGAKAISNSYGTTEYNGMLDLASSYDHPGTTITVSSGDYGFGPAQFPAVLDTVVAVGGTSLTQSKNGDWNEAAWAGAGSGCSAYVPKPAWQHDPHCHMRTVADVSAIADPDTGVAVYDSFGVNGKTGWFVVGGTSVASPLVAGVVGLAGNGDTLTPSDLYDHAKSLNDVVHGANGYCTDYLCSANGGYDGPTGWGTPNGVAGF